MTERTSQEIERYANDYLVILIDETDRSEGNFGSATGTKVYGAYTSFEKAVVALKKQAVVEIASLMDTQPIDAKIFSYYSLRIIPYKGDKILYIVKDTNEYAHGDLSYFITDDRDDWIDKMKLLREFLYNRPPKDFNEDVEDYILKIDPPSQEPEQESMIWSETLIEL